MFVSALIIMLYFLPFFVSYESVLNLLIIPEWGAVLGAVTFTLSFLSYLWAPRTYIFSTALAVYLLLVTTTAALVYSTGETSSAFIALWIVVAVFAGVFGVSGLLPIALVVLAYTAYLTISQGAPPFSQLAVIIAAGIVPLIASYIIWHSKKQDSGSDQAYRELANELNQATTKADVVIRAIDDGVIAVSSQGNIELINPSAQRIIGWRTNDAIGLNYQSVLKLRDKSDKEIDEATSPVNQVLATNKEVTTDELTITTEAGRKRLLSVTASPIGQIGEGAIIVFRDITTTKQEEREQAEFISTASHEMRTPVASIEGYLGLALNPATATIDEKAREFIEKAHESAQHLGRLFQDLLDVSKADDGRLQNNPRVIDVVEFLASVADGIAPRAHEKGLRYFFKPRTDDDASRSVSPVYYTNVDGDHLREVISNLIENAIKYTPKGDVIVDVTGDDSHVKISIQDSGIGIPPEDISHLFQKFYRVDNSATREIGGTGLGLYLCRRLTEVMGGRIWVESEFQKGSTFFVQLPRLAREEAMHMLDQATETAAASAELADDTQVEGAGGPPPSAPPQSQSHDPLPMPPVAPAQSVPSGAPAPAVTAPSTAQPPASTASTPSSTAIPVEQRPSSVAIPARRA